MDWFVLYKINIKLLNTALRQYILEILHQHYSIECNRTCRLHRILKPKLFITADRGITINVPKGY